MRNVRAQQERFEALLTSHAGVVGKVVRAYAFSAEDKQDLTQEIRFQAWRAFGRYDENRPFSTWLFRVALNVALDHSRRRRLRPLTVDISDEVTAPPDTGAALVDSILAELSDADRALLILLLEEYSHEEIAATLGLTPGAVTTRVSRLRSRLREKHGN
jgi:RNA polymerase sigma-70 factor, ECF subfamily